MGIIDFEDAKRRKMLDSMEYEGEVIITLTQKADSDNYQYILQGDMDVDLCQSFISDVLLDLKENEKIEHFEISINSVLNNPIRLVLFLPVDEREPNFSYTYEYVENPDKELDVQILAGFLTNLLISLS